MSTKKLFIIAAFVLNNGTTHSAPIAESSSCPESYYLSWSYVSIFPGTGFVPTNPPIVATTQSAPAIKTTDKAAVAQNHPSSDAITIPASGTLPSRTRSQSVPTRNISPAAVLLRASSVQKIQPLPEEEQNGNQSIKAKG
ncbi:MAG: hypothetical protein P4L31_05725 [Candidatus Babeliales bacterium]|nr:hypothetical protein [Candidatus Babeliales bacterium]